MYISRRQQVIFPTTIFSVIDLPFKVRFLIGEKKFIRRQKCVTYFNFFRLIHVFSISRCFGRRLQPIFRQSVNLTNHNTIQWYSRWNLSNRILIKEKSKRNWSMLMSSQDTTLLLYPVMSKCGYPVSAYSNIFQ